MDSVKKNWLIFVNCTLPISDRWAGTEKRFYRKHTKIADGLNIPISRLFEHISTDSTTTIPAQVFELLLDLDKSNRNQYIKS